MISNVNVNINRDLCFACGRCVDVCIMDNLRLHLAPCRSACPLYMNSQGYVRLLAQGKETEAAEEIRKYSPFGGILGRVCTHPCEISCEVGKYTGGAVHIRAIKRFLSDKYPEIMTRPPKIESQTGKKTAIVGSGPAGLTAAYDLRIQGHDVTVFDKSSEPGGLLRWAIPSFRLPVEVVDASIRMLNQMGIRFKTGVHVFKDIDLGNLEENYDAVLIAVGAGPSSHLNIPGESLEKVHSGLEFLKEVKEGIRPSLGNSVIVVGGGNAAVDVALVCRKLGVPEVRMISLESSSEMPAFRNELAEALEEQIRIENCWGPRKFVALPGGMIGVEVSRCTSVFNDQGEFCPMLEHETALAFKADSIIVAIGQASDLHEYPKDIYTVAGRLSVDATTLRANNREGIFCCGDAVTGPKSVVHAMAQGQEASLSISRYLSGEALGWRRDFFGVKGYLKEYEVDSTRLHCVKRVALSRLPVQARTMDDEVELALEDKNAKIEANRCLSCGMAAEANRTCWSCLPCEIECPTKALEIRLPYQIK